MLSRIVVENRQEIAAVRVPLHLVREPLERRRVDEAHAIGDFFDRPDFQSLALLQRRHVVRGLQHCFRRAGVEPGDAAPQQRDVQCPAGEIRLVHVGDLELSPRRGLQAFGDVHHVSVVEIQPRDGVVRLGPLGLLLDAQRALLRVELHHPVPLRVFHAVGEDGRALAPRGRVRQRRPQPSAIENVVAQDQRARAPRHELTPDDERLRQSFRLGLLGVTHVEPQPRAIAEQRAEPRHVLRRGNQQHVADPSEHEGRKRIVHERLVVHRQQLLRGAERERVEARAGAAGEDDAFSHRRGRVPGHEGRVESPLGPHPLSPSPLTWRGGTMDGLSFPSPEGRGDQRGEDGVVTIVIVSFNTVRELVSCLESVERSARSIPHEIILVDNASSDGTVETVRARFPTVRVIANQANVGFSKANNQALPLARGEYVLFLNPDAELGPGTLEQLVAALEGFPERAAVGPRVGKPSEFMSHNCARRLPTLWTEFCDLSWLARIFPRSRLFAWKYYAGWDGTTDRDVECLLGAAMLCRTAQVRALGGFDESVPLYLDDMDLCKRLGALGRLRYLSGVPLLHHYSVSTRKQPTALMKRLPPPPRRA